MSVYDRLQKKLDILKKEHGVNPIDFLALPKPLPRIMRLMLRALGMRYDELLAAVQALPERDRLSKAQLDAALKELVEQNWLLVSGTGDMTTYRVNLRRRAGTALGGDVWSSIRSHIVIEDPAQGPNPPASATGQEHP